MRRLLLLAAAVLLPFAGLVWFGFSLLKDPPPISLPMPEVQLPPPPPPPPVPPPIPTKPALRVDVPVIAPANPEELVRPPPPDPVQQKAPMIAAIEPLVQQCFKDVADKVREPLKVTVQFSTTAEGRFETITIKKASWPDPMLAACILDSFADAEFEPAGTPLRRQLHSFVYARPDAGR